MDTATTQRALNIMRSDARILPSVAGLSESDGSAVYHHNLEDTIMIRDLLYDDDMYAAAREHPRPKDLQGWNGDSVVIEKLVLQHRPHLVIEVGTWKGMSALSMHRHLANAGVEHEIVCIDTWLGSLEHMLWFRDELDYRGGRPTIFHQFMSNVVHESAEHAITPIAQDSVTAAKWLAHQRVRAPMIYLDASHEQGDVLRDIEAYWPLVSSGGVLFGDDHTPEWPGVVHDVAAFRARHGEEIATFAVVDRFWIAYKA